MTAKNNSELSEKPSASQTPIMILDEAYRYFGGYKDGLEEDLRTIEGVPNVTYLVKDGQVFVFGKLVQLIHENRKLHPDLPLADLARSLIAEAIVPAKEAVETWSIVPVPYEMVECPGGELMIRHSPFNARLPETYQTRADVQNAFANILLGGIQSGNGDFTYRGQPMTLCDPLDTSLLPPRPSIQCAKEPGYWSYAPLGSVPYEQGFEPISVELFDDVRELEATWKDDSARSALQTQDHAADVWARVASLRLQILDDVNDEVPEYGQQDFAELYPLYPELSMLSDGALYKWFDVYQMECCLTNEWTAHRADDFLFYLLGKVAGRQYESETARVVGEWVGYALLQGESLDRAIAFGRASALYNTAISSLAWRIADAMRFLAADKKATELHGHAITTMMDIFRIDWNYNAMHVIVEQNFTELDNNKHYGA